ncbi:MAG TPA: DUF87 domain-containing protein [Aquificales bacterium]|nr:DUF87 domain-containing protein [Aquificales bacterium]
MDFIPSQNLFEELRKAFSSARKGVKIVSPWVGGNLFAELLKSIPQGVEISLILRAGEVEDLKITPPEAFKEVETRKGEIFLHPTLHAKFVIVDRRLAFVGSANLTDRGLNRFGEGNSEAVVKTTDKNLIGELEEYFETLKGGAVRVDNTLVGSILGELSPIGGEALILEPIEVGEFLLLPSEGGSVILRVEGLKRVSKTLGGSTSELPKGLFVESSQGWKKAFLHALLLEGGALWRAELSVAGVWDGKTLKRLETPPRSGGLLFKVEKGLLDRLAKTTPFGAPMVCPIYVGKGKGFDAFLELAQVWSRHAAVFGITGSGKSYLTQRVVSRSATSDCGVRFFILDPQGEYERALKDLLGDRFKGLVSVRRFPKTLFPLSLEDFVELLEALGFSHLLKGNSSEVRLLRDRVASFLKPLLGGLGFSNLSLGAFLEELQREFPDLSDELGALVEEIRLLFGEEVLKNQKEVSKLIFKPFGGRVEIFDLSEVSDTRSRLNIAGLLLKRLFFGGDKGRRIVVVEEAHNFAPERGFGDAEAGRRNLALLMLEKIAAEGRKLNLGLWLVAQRPAQVNKYVLSQTNTHFLFRLTDKNDLSAVESYISTPSGDVLKSLPTFGVGECYATGLGFPFGMTLRVD